MSPRTAVASPRSQTTPAQTASEVRAGQVFDAALVVLFLALTFLLGVFPLKDTDFWWHLKAGDLIRQTGWVPTVDTLTFGAEGHRWVDLHWIYQLLISWGFEQFGVIGLNLAKCIVTCFAVLLLVTSGRKEWPTWATCLAWVPALLVLGGRMYVRPETLTLLYLATDLAILARWDQRPWLAFGLPVVQLFWVNTQGLFVFGPYLIFIALADAATRRGAFDPDRRQWWRTTLLASALSVVVCLINPYGYRGAIYPLELLGTMGNPIFKRSIGELKPLPTLYAEIGLNSLPLVLHLVTMALGGLSFLIPATWRIWTQIHDRRSVELASQGLVEAKSTVKVKAPRKKPTRNSASDLTPERPLRWFRLVLFLTFSGLSVSATRNSHQFAAIVGTMTAWNFSEWVAEIVARHRRMAEGPPPSPKFWPRLITLGVLGATIVAVGSGRFDAWSGEGRTIALGEEPTWFPHAATKFAGSPAMPDRLVGFHNGHPSLYEYYWGPDKKVYTDARLEVMGPDLYEVYLALQSKIARNERGWNEDLVAMGHPSVLIDNVDASNGELVATMLNDRRWHCVWFDPVASVFVDNSYPDVIRGHEVDFLDLHYRGGAESSHEAPATTLAMVKALRGVATQIRFRAGGEQKGRALIWLGLDYARRLKILDPRDLDGYKQAGLLNYLQDPLPGEKPIPRHRLPFDLSIDLPLVSAAYNLRRGLAIDPDDGISLWSLALLDTMRGMDESALPLVERFLLQPNKNLSQQKAKVDASEKVAQIIRRLGPSPNTGWKNLNELEQVFERLIRSGRALTAVEVTEAAHRDDVRHWVWADRLATIRLHLGQPARAREIWRKSVDPPAAIQSTRIAVTYQVEGDFDSARKSYAEATASDPRLFEAHYGLASLEQAVGRANQTVEAARLAEKFAPSDRCHNLARQLINEATPYCR